MNPTRSLHLRCFLVALLAAAALVPACRSIPFAEPKLEGEYGAALKAHTREAALVDNLETRAFVHLIYVSPELAERQAEKLSLLRGEPPSVAAERKVKARADAAAPTFFAVVTTPSAQWNDWESKSSSWRIALGPELVRVPASVQRFERPFTVELLTLYPYLDDFHTGYQLVFDGKLEGLPKLQVSGALGKMQFDWAAME